MSVVKLAEGAVEAVEELLPPSDGEDRKVVRRWQVWISLAAIVNAIGLAGHIALACGFAAPFYPGFAQASEVQSVRDELKQQRIGMLEVSILDTKQKQCNAAPQVKQLYLNALIKMMQEYQKLTGQQYPEIDCKSL